MGPDAHLGFDRPDYWLKKYDKAVRWSLLPSGELLRTSDTFLDEDYCAIENRDFFVRGLIHLPIIGAAETFRWGVWGSLSRENFEKLLKADEEPARNDLCRNASPGSGRRGRRRLTIAPS